MNPRYNRVLGDVMGDKSIIAALNKELAWELRAVAMYAHYSAYVSGIHRPHLSVYFSNEVNESITHASTVRSAIVKLDGKAITERAPEEIVHTHDYSIMLEEAYKTEKIASGTYQSILPMIEELGDDELYDSLEVIYFDEMRSVEELRMMLK